MKMILMKSKMLQGMKKIFSRVMLVAAAAMTFFACQKPEVIVPEFEEVNGLAFSSDKPSFDDETKTQWTGESIQWSAGDKIRVAYTCDGVWQNADGTSESSEESGSKTAKIYESKAITEAGSTAFFSVPGYFKGTAEGVYEFYGIYPSSLVSDPDIKYAPSVTITIPTTQTPTASSFDSAADVMASKSQSYVGIPKVGENNENNGPISLKWERLVAHGHFTIKNLAVEGEEDIQTITLTANAGADMVGTHYLYLDTYNVVKPNSNAAPNSITIDARNLSIDSEGNVTFWACFLPCTWTSIDVKAETDKASYTRKIDLSSNQKTFAKNARNILAINMASAVREVKSSNALPFVKDFSDKEGTNGITELDGFTVSGSVYNATGAIRLAKGEAGGSITTQSLDLSCDFHVKVTASGWDSDELSLIVSSGDQSETVTLSAVGNGNSGPGECAEHIINFQPVSNSSSVTFAAAEGKRCYIKKIEILEGHAVAAPVLKATAPNEIAAAGGDGSFNFTLANPQDGQSVSAESNVDWITEESVSGNTVTYTVAENTSEEPREGTITLSYEGAESVDVTITQAAAEQSGGSEGVETVVEIVAANLGLADASTLTNIENGLLVFAKGSNTSNAPKYYNNGTNLRMYAGNTLTISAPSGSTLTSIEFTFSGSNYDNLSASLGSYSNCKWSGNAESVIFTTAAVKQTRITKVVVTYSTSGGNVDGDEPPVGSTLTPRNLTFSEATATATMGQAFTAPTLNGEKTGVKYSSTNTNVATVNETTGAVTLVAAGTTTITASAPATDEYEAGTASYTLTVSAAQPEPDQPESTVAIINVAKVNAVKAMGNGKYGDYKDKDVSIAIDGLACTAKNICANSKDGTVKMAAQQFIQLQGSKGYLYNTSGKVKSIKVWTHPSKDNGTFMYVGSESAPSTNATMSKTTEAVQLKDNNGNSVSTTLNVYEVNMDGDNSYFNIKSSNVLWIYKLEVTYSE